MVSSITSTTDTSTAAAAMKKSLGMNKDDFLKLFIAQLQYQDPLKPQDPSAMLDQLSQLSLVEQSYNNNTALNNLIATQNDATTMNSVSYIGKTIKANGNAAVFDGTNQSQLQFSIPVTTAESTLKISDASGSTVRTVSLGALASGDASYTWDGRDNSGTLLPAGAYSFSVAGSTSGGTAVTATTYTAGRVDGVSITNGKAVLTVGGAEVSLADLISIKGV